MNAFVKKTITATIAAVSLGAAIAASASPAEARWGRNAALFGGIGAGLIGAAIIANHAHARPAYNSCWVERRAVYNAYGDFVGYRGVRVCN